LSDLPKEWAGAFLSSKILVVAVNSNEGVVGVSGIRSVFNITTTYIYENWRGKGLGTKMHELLVIIAKKRHLCFFLFGVRSDSMWDKKTSDFGSKEIVSLKKSNLRFKIFPLNFLGCVVYWCSKVITYLLPNRFSEYISIWIHNKTWSQKNDS
jgi:predicted GNAT family acetyltransferase